MNAVRGRLPTAVMAAAGLISGYAVAAGTGSRPLGGVVLAAWGLACVSVWWTRDGRRVTAWLTAIGLIAFVLSHVLALLVGAWAAVLLVAGVTAYACWRLSDSRHLGTAAPFTQRSAR